jgi:hypothetical protein
VATPVIRQLDGTSRCTDVVDADLSSKPTSEMVPDRAVAAPSVAANQSRTPWPSDEASGSSCSAARSARCRLPYRLCR